MNSFENKYLKDLNESLLNKKQSSLTGDIEKNINTYTNVKEEYLKLGNIRIELLSAKVFVYLLLIAIDWRDISFCRVLINNHNFKNIDLDSAKIALARFYKIEGRLYDVSNILYPLFESDKLKSVDIETLFDALQKTAQYDKCDKVLKYALEKYKGFVGWQILALKYQVGIVHLYPKNKNFIINNIKFLKNKCKTSEEIYFLGAASYQAGLIELGFECLKNSFFYPSNLDDWKDEEAHGFSPDIAFQSMLKLIDIIDDQGIKAFPVFGSLLGLYRDGQFMDYDKDVDVGVFIDDVASLNEFIKEICVRGKFAAPCMVTQPSESHKWNVAIVDIENNVSIDIFFFHKNESNSYESGIYTAGGVLKWIFKDIKLEQSTIAGNELWAPANIEEHLAEIYGNSWNQKIEVWDSLINCPNLSNDSNIPVNYYALQRLYKAIKQKKLLKINNYIDGLGGKWAGIVDQDFLTKIKIIRDEIKNNSIGVIDE